MTWQDERIEKPISPIETMPLFVRRRKHFAALDPVVQYVSEKPADPVEACAFIAERMARSRSTKIRGDNYNYEKGAFAGPFPLTWTKRSGRNMTIGARTPENFQGCSGELDVPGCVPVNENHGVGGVETADAGRRRKNIRSRKPIAVKAGGLK